MVEISVRVQSEPFDISVECAKIAGKGYPNTGALVTFTGLCRHEDGALNALELDYYPGMAEREISRIAQGAGKRWALNAITVIHRYGKLVPGDTIVLIVTASRHRRAAFEGAEFIMDYLKTQAPFWKKQHYADGRNSAWLDARQDDDEALARWNLDEITPNQ